MVYVFFHQPKKSHILINVVVGLCAALLIWPTFFSALSYAESTNHPMIDNLIPHVIPLNLPADRLSGGGVIAADVNNDGQPDFIVTKPGYVAAYTYDGNELWIKRLDIQVRDDTRQVKHQQAVLGQVLPGTHGPGVQVADVDGDRHNEVLFLTTDSTLHLLQGSTGEILHQVQLPVPDGAEQWEHLVVANFRGQGDRDLLLQAMSTEGHPVGRFLAAYAIDDLLQSNVTDPLWTHDDFFSAAHNGARVADLDDDGRDEVIGGMLVSPDGEVLFEVPIQPDSDLKHPHIDGVYIADIQPDRPGLEVVILEESSSSSNSILGINHPHLNRILRLGNRLFFGDKPTLWAAERVLLYGVEGLIWQSHFNYLEPQNATIGDFDLDHEGLEIWCRSRLDVHQTPFVFDAQGELLTNYELTEVAPDDWTIKGLEVINTIDWTGDSIQLAVAKARHESGDVAIFEPGTGQFRYRFQEEADRLYVADVVGDWREEVVVLNGDELHIYQNPATNPNPNQSSLWSQNHYQRNKMTWNYYSP
jgi:hypothetical protein